MNHLLVTTIVLVLVFFVNVCICQKKNPCPKVFEYSVMDGRIFGIITIPPPKVKEWTHLQVSIATNGVVQNNNRFLRLNKPRNETAKDALNGNNIKYLMLLPIATENPTIKIITLNNKVLCNENSSFFNNTWSFKHSFYFGEAAVQTEHSSNIEEIYPSFSDWLFAHGQLGENASSSTTSKIPTTPKISINRRMPSDGIWVARLPLECGIGKRMTTTRRGMLVPRPLILNGDLVDKNEFPWLVYFQYEEPEKICGGTLVSDRHIITAAHCVTPHNVISVHLGKFDRLNFMEAGSKRVKPIKIIPQSEYRSGEPHADIAVVVIDPLVRFTPQIRPACVWPYGTEFDRDPQFQLATVAGWGVFMDSDNNVSRLPMKTVVPIVDLDICRKSDALFKELATDHTICAGGQLSGPCPGDSGSGLYFQFNDVWYLRGIVSISAGTQLQEYCTSQYYSVYVDVAFYLDWLKPIFQDVNSVSPRFKPKAVIEIDNYI